MSLANGSFTNEKSESQRGCYLPEVIQPGSNLSATGNKSSDPGLLFAGRFLITVLISVLVMVC